MQVGHDAAALLFNGASSMFLHSLCGLGEEGIRGGIGRKEWDKEKWDKRVEYLKQHGDEIAQEINKMNEKTNG